MNSIKDIYRNGIDFQELGSTNVNIQKLLDSDGYINFTKPENVEELTRALLQRDFGLELTLPGDRLCPPVPIRLQYVLWIQDLLDSTGGDFADTSDPNTHVWGMDIGTGASCIYPLLGCALHPTWSFVATEIDEKSTQYAEKNIVANGYTKRIFLHKVTRSDTILSSKYIDRQYGFTMCNPPFYASEREFEELASEKDAPPNSACTGAANEMICPGGEVAFVSQMITESLLFKNSVKWFTSMLGKFGSVSIIVERLHEIGIKNWAVMEFAPGNQTKRWGVAWSFGGMRPKVETARGAKTLDKKLLPFPTRQSFVIKLAVAGAKERLKEVMGSLEFEHIRDGVYISEGDVWSRSARRTRKRKDISSLGLAINSASRFAIACTMSMEKETEKTTVDVRWLMGMDSVIFESFCGMLKRKLAGND